MSGNSPAARVRLARLRRRGRGQGVDREQSDRDHVATEIRGVREPAELDAVDPGGAAVAARGTAGVPPDARGGVHGGLGAAGLRRTPGWRPVSLLLPLLTVLLQICLALSRGLGTAQPCFVKAFTAPDGSLEPRAALEGEVVPQPSERHDEPERSPIRKEILRSEPSACSGYGCVLTGRGSTE